MRMMKIRICDVCQKPLIKQSHKIKIHRRWRFNYSSGWDRLDVCERCADRIIYEINNEITEIKSLNSGGEDDG